ncbi:hypothetical protein HDU96_006986 [Phlyctochytrium bullatum]|nr:hypothetical protein HDU96_006986 [Phlyctochytrium bullatum]
MSDVDRLRRREDDAAEAVKEARRGVTRAEEAVTRAEEAVRKAEKRLQRLLDLEIHYFENPGSDADGQRLEKLNDLLDKASAALKDREAGLKEARAALTEARAALKDREAALKERETAVEKERAELAAKGISERWSRLVLSACERFGVDLAQDDPFLGAGATARVVKVQCEDGSVAALKVVLSKHLDFLEEEASVLAREACQNTGVAVKLLKPVTLLDDGLGAAILISPVGEPLKRDDLTKNDIRSIFQSLFKLHQAGILHGDARLPNLIQHQTTYLWIDFRPGGFSRLDMDTFTFYTPPVDDRMYVQDVQELCASILDTKLTWLPEALMDAIWVCEKRRTWEVYERVAELVWEGLEVQREEDGVVEGYNG